MKWLKSIKFVLFFYVLLLGLSDTEPIYPKNRAILTMINRVKPKEPVVTTPVDEAKLQERKTREIVAGLFIFFMGVYLWVLKACSPFLFVFFLPFFILATILLITGIVLNRFDENESMKLAALICNYLAAAITTLMALLTPLYFQYSINLGLFDSGGHDVNIFDMFSGYIEDNRERGIYEDILRETSNTSEYLAYIQAVQASLADSPPPPPSPPHPPADLDSGTISPDIAGVMTQVTVQLERSPSPSDLAAAAERRELLQRTMSNSSRENEDLPRVPSNTETSEEIELLPRLRTGIRTNMDTNNETRRRSTRIATIVRTRSLPR